MARGSLWWIVALALLAGCPGGSSARPPVIPSVTVVPPVEPVPWWTQGNGACPPLHGQPAPGGPPGTSVTPGYVAGSPAVGEVHCEAGGVAHGPATKFHAGGRPAESGLLDRGTRSGPWTTWHVNGKLASHGPYAAGRPIGVWSSWYPSGSPRDVGELGPEHAVGVWLEWEDGAPTHSSADRFTEYSKSGSVKMRGYVRGDALKESLLVCAIGMAFPACRILPLVDFGIVTPHSEPGDDSSRSEATLELGVLVNIDEKHGVGGTYGWRFDATYPASQLGGRYRYWVHDYIAVEGGAAVLFPRDDHPGQGRLGMTAQGGLVLADVLTLIIAVERHPTGEAASDTLALAGIRIGLPTILGGIIALGELASVAKW